MIEELKEEKLIEKVGGRFKLTSLIQKRLAVLNRGAMPLIEYSDESKPLVDVPTGEKMKIVVREILEDKIRLDMDGNLVANVSPLPFDPES